MLAGPEQECYRPAVAGTTLIPPNTRIDGSLETSGDLLIEGRCDGEIRAGGTVTVAGGAVCRAAIRARAATIHGEVIGPVQCTESIAVTRGARIVGEVRAPEVSIDGGARVDGKVDLLAPDAEPANLQRLPATTRGPALRRPTPPETGR